MRKPLSSLVMGLLCAATIFWTAPSLPAQIRIAREAMADTGEVDEVLRVGEQLEQQRRWGEALSHYEQAVRRHPDHNNLQQRLDLAKLHYDVTRRYSDSSFAGSMTRLSDQQADDLYGEVLLKIHAHYVAQPNWQRLVERGTTGLEIALLEPPFREYHRVSASAVQCTAFAADLKRHLAELDYHSRHDAREAARMAAEMASRRFQLPVAAVLLEYVCAGVNGLDDYSTFLTHHQLDEVLSQIDGNFVGLGIELKADRNSLLIVNVIKGGPAEAAGLRPQERITHVDHFGTLDITTEVAADMLKGPEGSSVDLTILDPSGNSRVVRVTRSRVEVPSVDKTEILDQQFGVAYLRLASFQKTTSRDVEAALWQLHRQGMRSLIVDVRGNPGGLLTAAVEVADKFISQGAIVATRGRSSGEDYDYRAHLIGTWRVPLIVLIDGDSASASEIFAGAIRDHRRGTLVGFRSYGKGSVQGIFPLNVAQVGVRLTTAKFYSPNGAPIGGRGVTPDVVVRTTARPVNDGGALVEAPVDPVLESGLQVARQQLSQR